MMYGLVGKALGHSFSPELHRLIWGCEDYRLLPMEEAEARAFFARRGFKGVNVTIPYKRLALDCCDRVDPHARAIGAVNTVVNRNGELWGYNTDYQGLRYCIESAGIDLKGKKVLVFGSGGASKTAVALSGDLGAGGVVVVSRSGENTYDNLEQHRDAQVLINATPLGMWPEIDGICAHPGDFPRCTGVVDIVYNPLTTRLVYETRELGIPATAGLSMLAAQAVAAAERFLDKTFPADTIEACTRSLEKKLGCIVLIGMPGCGKTTVGRLLAKRLNRPFLDTDVMVEEAAGLPIPEIFSQRGEAAFRELESTQVKKACLSHGTVISVGGGAVLTEQNRFYLKSCGRVYYLRRDIHRLELSGRPLSTDRDALHALYQARRAIYEGLCDREVDCNQAAEQAAQIIAEEYEE